MALVKRLNEGETPARFPGSRKPHDALRDTHPVFSLTSRSPPRSTNAIHLFLLLRHCRGPVPLPEVHFFPPDMESRCRYAV